MQKNMLLNLLGVAALSLLCACGPSEEPKHEVKADDKHVEAELPTEEVTGDAQATMQVAEAEPASEEVTPAPEVAEAVAHVAEAEVPTQEQKA